jgi:hypothetical protein
MVFETVPPPFFEGIYDINTTHFSPNRSVLTKKTGLSGNATDLWAERTQLDSRLGALNNITDVPVAFINPSGLVQGWYLN